MNRKFIFLLLFFLVLAGCRTDEPAKPEQEKPPPPAPTITEEKPRDCTSCHQDIRQDPLHQIACPECHHGDPAGGDAFAAHQGLIARPAHPRFMQSICGQCHGDRVNTFQSSLHLTLYEEVNLVRKHFGAGQTVADLTRVPADSNPDTALGLADDLLRRRCLRCHLYTSGDDYPYTNRGTGCSACHMEFVDGKPTTHEIIKPTDRQCLSCHYANFVGGDYYGWYEHDYNWEYRTPYITRAPYIRPYGVEFHELVPDIHQQRGLTCIDCHTRHELMTGSAPPLSCSSCHRQEADNHLSLPPGVAMENGILVLTARSGEKHVIPQPVHPAHRKYGREVACQVCHAQWSFNDSTTSLLRSDTEDFGMWERLAVQSSSEIERLVEYNLQNFADLQPPAMRDGLTGLERPGAWFKGFTQRRWEDIPVQRDVDGVIKVFRPILDLRLSYIDSDWEVIFDNLGGTGPVMLPYTPHTTGPAGLFYLDRFSRLLETGPAGEEDR